MEPMKDPTKAVLCMVALFLIGIAVGIGVAGNGILAFCIAFIAIAIIWFFHLVEEYS